MSNRAIVLHIGFSKTGSSALQVFLSQNQNLLARYNYDYPEIDPYHFEKAKKGEISSGNGHLLREVLRQDTQNASLNQSARLLTPFLSADGRNSTFIVSSESFGVMTEEEIAFFSRLLRQFSLDVKIICYVRRQDQYIEAAWKQWQSKLSDSLQLDAIKPRINWRQRLDAWAKHFGKENIVVRPYEKSQLPHGVIPDFLDILGIAWKDQLENLDLNINHGFTQDVMDFRQVNKGFSKDIHDHRLDEFLYEVLDDRFTKKMFDHYQILSPREKLEILKFCDEDNQFIAREYLGREDGRLFYEPWPSEDETWQPYAGLTLERYIPIATQIEFSLYQKNQQLTGELTKTQEQIRALEERILKLEGGKKVKSGQGLSGRVENDATLKGLTTRARKYFQLRREIKIIRSSGLFDEAFYLRTNPDVAKSGVDPIRHYVANGWQEGRDPAPGFSTANYLAEHPDIAVLKLNPFVQYILDQKNNSFKMFTG